MKSNLVREAVSGESFFEIVPARVWSSINGTGFGDDQSVVIHYGDPKKMSNKSFRGKILISLATSLFFYLNISNMKTFIVYFEQNLGVAHLKHLQNYAIITFFVQKNEKKSKII